MNNIKNVYFDICGTLYESNTTNDFIYYISDKNIFNSLMFKSKFIIILNLLILKLTGRNLLREFYYSKLSGISKEKLLKLAEKFYVDFLINKKIDFSHHLFEKYKKQNTKIHLISATIDPVCFVIANELNIDHYYSSELKYDESEICLGGLKKDLAGIKSKMIDEKNIDVVITDNLSDIDLIKNSKKVYIISKKSKYKKWKVLLINFKVQSEFYLK